MSVTPLRKGDGTPFDQAVARRTRSVTPELDELAAQINVAHQQVWRAGRTALEHAVRCGQKLLEAQERIPRGSWLRWLDAEVDVHPTSAYKYMRLARHADRITGANGVEAALKLVAAEPWHERRKLSDEDRLEMVRLAGDHTLEEIASAFGCAVSTVSRWTSSASPVRDQLLERAAVPPRQRCPHCGGTGWLP